MLKEQTSRVVSKYLGGKNVSSSQDVTDLRRSCAIYHVFALERKKLLSWLTWWTTAFAFLPLVRTAESTDCGVGRRHENSDVSGKTMRESHHQSMHDAPCRRAPSPSPEACRAGGEHPILRAVEPRKTQTGVLRKGGEVRSYPIGRGSRLEQESRRARRESKGRRKQRPGVLSA